MRYINIYALYWMLAFCASCGAQNKQGHPKDNSRSAYENTVTFSRSNDPSVHTKYEYVDANDKRLIIQNGNPRGGLKYTDPDGEVYAYAVFWTRIINKTDDPLELNIDFLESYEVPSFPGKYYKLMVPPDTLTLEKEDMFDYGLTNLESFLNKNIHKPTSLKRIINPKETSGFYVVKLSQTIEGGAILRTGLTLKGQDLFYSVSVYDNSPSQSSLIIEKEIPCGRINLKNLVLQK